MGVEGLVGPIVVAELENAGMAIGGRTGEEASAFMGSPRDHVDGGSVEREVEHFGPCAAAHRRGGILRLLSPDQDLAIVRGGSEDCAKLGVGLQAKQITAVSNREHRGSAHPQLTHATHHTAPS